jgi:probable addiction module antidote protein
MKKKMDEFDKLVVGQLKDPEFALAYLNEHLSYTGPKRLELILDALHKVAEARGINAVVKKSKISRRTLFHALSKSGNPTLETFLKLLDAVDVKINFDLAHHNKKASGE